MSFLPDSISPRITLYYKNNLQHSSLFSCLLSLFTYISILIFSCFFLNSFFSKSFPNAFYFTKFINDTGIFYLNKSSIFHSIILDNYTSYEPRAISAIGLKNTKILSYLLDPNPANYDHWIYDICDLEQFPKNVLAVKKEELDKFSKALCISHFYNKTTKKIIDISDPAFVYPSVEHGDSSPNSVYYGIIIQQCRNSSMNNNSCLSQNEIDDNLKSLEKYLFYFVDNSVNVENYHEPFSNYFPDISSVVSKKSFVVNNLNFFPVTIRTHNGLLFDFVDSIYSHNYNLNEKATYDTSDSGIIGSVYVWMPNRLEVYERSYDKLQNLAGSIGGVSKLIISISQIINFFYHEYIVLNDFNYEMFSIKKKNAKKNMFKASNTSLNRSKSMMIKEKPFPFSNNYFKSPTETKRAISPQSPYKSFNKFPYMNIPFFSFIASKFTSKSNSTGIKQIEELRMKLLSEENIYKMYNKLQKIKQFLKKNITSISRQASTKNLGTIIDGYGVDNKNSTRSPSLIANKGFGNFDNKN